MLSKETIQPEFLLSDKDGERIFEIPSDMSEDGRKVNMDEEGEVRVNLRFLGTRSISRYSI